MAIRPVADLPGQTVVNASQIVTIGVADPETASPSNISIGVPIARVPRTAVNRNGAIFLLANVIYPGRQDEDRGQVAVGRDRPLRLRQIERAPEPAVRFGAHLFPVISGDHGSRRTAPWLALATSEA
ncbi:MULTISPECIES: hypothetical protein [unclassified Mameliella]|uniref:hypothetical protein n=1 Tax=unclassified Mameliella TaxID=2630630 RepID=UPI00273DF96F|nr:MULTISPECIES: hypothetical protein [unclassified Mameliella]